MNTRTSIDMFLMIGILFTSHLLIYSLFENKLGST